MELQTAIAIFEHHQEWRLGKREDLLFEPKTITEALDIVLAEVKKNDKPIVRDLEEQDQPSCISAVMDIISCINAVMGIILKELEERKQWAENGMMVYSDDTGMRTEYQARMEEVENAIWVINQYCHY